MKIPNPGQVGFNLNQFLGKMTRVALKEIRLFGTASAGVDFLGGRFPAAEPMWLSRVANWVTDGIAAIKSAVMTGVLGEDIMALTPIVPTSVFPLQQGERFLIVGDAVSTDAAGNEIDRRLTTVGGWENSALADLMGQALYELLQKIRSTNPEEADTFIDNFFEAHWMGRIF